ncbi:MAG: pentapeptide repeat-containing protein, partial [Clostridia bacterium]|nr:pentapeptide repeat-containing protein [Clostridia bacterium]
MERPTPEQHKELELMTREFISHEYPDYNGHFTLYGRNGQRQYGCDVKDQAGTLIVQCKCYDNYDKDSGNKLVEKVGEDYENACGHFPKMELFAVCTTLSSSAGIEDKLKAFKKDVPIHVYFWEDIESVIHSSYTANKEYAKQFEEPLFLHKDDPKVCLKNLFVPQKYSEGSDPEGNPRIFNDLYDRIARFVSDQDKLLIIEGDAGCGKTSLVQSLCYHDWEGDELAKRMLGGRPLVTVKLRDLEKSLISSERGLMPAMFKYLGIECRSRNDEGVKELNRRFPNAVLVLDGFDELCIMDSIKDHDMLLYKLAREELNGWKIIVVSRPNFIHRAINVLHSTIGLEHFDSAMRQRWMDRFTSPDCCGGGIEDGLRKFILDNSEEGVCDTPLTLYLLVSKSGIDEKTRKNLWRLYNRIFGEEISDRRYDTYHPRMDMAEASYMLAELVAHEIYLTGNEKLYVDEEQLVKIAKKLPGKYKEKCVELAKHCLSLSCYWKVGERGMAEFYHNNIRDFFLCEMIWRRVNDIYCSRLDDGKKREALIAFFKDNFRRGALEPKVCEFIRLRAEACKEDGTAGFPKCEKEHPLLPDFFEKMLTDGRVYNELCEKQLLRVISSILHCVMGFYQAAIQPFLVKDDTIIWYTSPQRINESLLLRTALSNSLSTIKPDLSYCCFADADLSNTHLRDACFIKTKLMDANLTGAYLNAADLHYADLTHADLRHAALTLANLTLADL